MTGARLHQVTLKHGTFFLSQHVSTFVFVLWYAIITCKHLCEDVERTKVLSIVSTCEL
jgi:hypothetical protein